MKNKCKKLSAALVLCLSVGLCSCSSELPVDGGIPLDIQQSKTTESSRLTETTTLTASDSRQAEAAASTTSASTILRTSTTPKSRTTSRLSTAPRTAATSQSSASSSRRAASTTEDMNEKYPVTDGREWRFFSTDSVNRLPDWPLEYERVLSVIRVTIQENLDTAIFIDQYVPLADYTGTVYDPQTVITYNGEEYLWQVTRPYTGGCFPIMGGSVEIELRCYDDHGNFVTDDLMFIHTEKDTLLLIRNSGQAVPLVPGNTLKR